MRKMRTALTIAGSDSSGGAGIQADIKTMTANGVFAMSAITALTAQNTTGVAGIMEASPEFLKQQIDCIFTDIRPDAVKIGMVSSAELIIAIAEKLAEYQAENIVVDPVMVATSGAKLISDDAIDTLKERLLPMADIRIDNPNTHGTGCTLSSAIASNLAKGFDMDTSVERAKAYISGALGAMLDLGKGSGPMNHAFDITGEYVKTPEDIAKGIPENTVTESAVTGTDMPSAGKETV